VDEFARIRAVDLNASVTNVVKIGNRNATLDWLTSTAASPLRDQAEVHHGR
jgi:hypothetical protein